MTDKMTSNEKKPLWVDLAFSVIEKRKHAVLLIAASIIFTLYCLPWAEFFVNQPWVSTLFLITDWSWFVMMIPILVWYFAALVWMDKHAKWQS